MNEFSILDYYVLNIEDRALAGLLNLMPSCPSSLEPPVNTSPFRVTTAECVTPNDSQHGSNPSLGLPLSF